MNCPTEGLSVGLERVSGRRRCCLKPAAAGLQRSCSGTVAPGLPPRGQVVKEAHKGSRRECGCVRWERLCRIAAKLVLAWPSLQNWLRTRTRGHVGHLDAARLIQ